MKSSQISSASYRARVRWISKSQLLSVHRDNNIRFRRVKIENVRRTSSKSQQLNKSDSQSVHHATTFDFQSKSDIKFNRISSRPCIKRIDLSDIQSIYDKKSWKPHIALLKEISPIQLTNPGSTQVSLFINIRCIYVLYSSQANVGEIQQR
jgi:hypothetical protein